MQAGVFCFFRWYQRHFEFQSAHVAVEGRSNVVLNMHAQLQISLLKRFPSLLHKASQCEFGDGVHRLLVFLYPFSSMAISPQNNEKNVFYAGKLYGLTGMDT